MTLDEEGKARKTVIESYLLKKKKDIMANKLHVCKCEFKYMLRIE